MRITTTAGREDDYFTASVHVPSGEFAYQQPTLHLRNSDIRIVVFLDIDEARDLLETLTANVDALQAADDCWAAERRAEREAKDAARQQQEMAEVQS